MMAEKYDYSELDAAIIKAIKFGDKHPLHDRQVDKEAFQISVSHVDRIDIGRLIDRRLQYLRKQGRITYTRKYGWQLLEREEEDKSQLIYLVVYHDDLDLIAHLFKDQKQALQKANEYQNNKSPYYVFEPLKDENLLLYIHGEGLDHDYTCEIYVEPMGLED